MHSIVADKISQLTELCRKHSVRRLDLIGSAADGTFDPAHSDVDFSVEFQPVTRRGFDDVYFQLLADLEALLGRRVDLIEVGCVKNSYVLASIERSRVPLYAAA